MKGQRLTGWRRVATSTWRAPSDPQVYGDLRIDAGNLRRYIDDVRRFTGVQLTPTHLVVRAVGRTLDVVPELNVRLRRGRAIHRPSADVFVIVATDSGRDLTGIKLARVDAMTACEVAADLRKRRDALAAGQDELAVAKRRFGALPPRLFGTAMRIGTWLACDLDLDLPRLGLPRQPFGSAMVSSVGMLGLSHAYSALSPYYRVPFLILVGEISVEPMTLENRVVARPVLPLTATLDHRYVDAAGAARLAAAMREYLRDPARFEPPLRGAVVRLPEPAARADGQASPRP